ncbi:MAG: hemolysin family protein [Verrucomicrobia bacterium]|nr:hemolysin family protein [Verrucomicrobiota bacterium]
MGFVEQSATNIALIILLLAANAFFVAAEFALVKARRFRIESMAAGGGFAAKLTVRIQGDLEAYLAACQLGITMASLGLGWVGEPTVAAFLTPLLEPLELSEKTIHLMSFSFGFVIFSSLHIVVGEQVPKTFAIRRPESISILVAMPLRVFYVVCYPLNWALNKASRSILALFNVEEAPHAEVLSDDEIRGIVNTSAKHGDLEQDKAEMIHNLFRFDERAVERVMIPRVECAILRLDAAADVNIAIMKGTKHSRFPLVASGVDNLVGVVLMKDLVDAMLSGQAEPWQDLNSFCREPLIVPETLKVSRLFETMRTEKAHLACVLDEYGSFVGLVTMEDLLEEIVGEIVDETDDEASEFPIIPEGSGWQAHGFSSLTDVERDTGYAIPADFNANTLSGLFMDRLQRIPVVGDQIEDGNYRFTVTAAKDRHVETVKIERIDAAQAEPL